MSFMDSFPAAILQTDFGQLKALITDEHAITVRAGYPSHTGDENPPLKLKRGVEVSYRGHWRINPGTGEVYAAPHPPTFKREHRSQEPNALQMRAVTAAAREALQAFVETPKCQAMLTLAGDAKRTANVNERVSTAAKLRQVADQLEAEAEQLRAGGRVSRRRHSHTSGLQTEVVQVMRADGTLMDPVAEPPTVYGTSRYGMSHVTRNIEV